MIQTGHFHGLRQSFKLMLSYIAHISVCVLYPYSIVHIDCDDSNWSFPRPQTNIQTYGNIHSTHEDISCNPVPLYSSTVMIQTGHFHGPKQSFKHMQSYIAHISVCVLYPYSIVHIDCDDSNWSFPRPQTNIQTYGNIHSTHQDISCNPVPLYSSTVMIQTGHFHGPRQSFKHMQSYIAHISVCVLYPYSIVHIDYDDSNWSFPRPQTNIQTYTIIHSTHISMRLVSLLHCTH